MKPFLLRQEKADAVDTNEPDFPLPVDDPTIRSMHRECVLGGCSYRSRFLSNAGWALALTFLLVAAVTALYSARTNEALLKENALLNQQIDALNERLAAVSTAAPAAPPAEKEPGKAASPPKAVLSPRRSVPQSKPSPSDAVPESEKWWNRP
jgi:hypothetical protein